MMQPEQTELAGALDADAVMRFLTMNPEFFMSHQDVLPRLRIPHPSGKAVSLIERQVSVLRGKCSTLENSLRDLISVARENEQLHQRLHSLIQDIISAQTLEEIVALTRSSVLENFKADAFRVFLISENAAIHAIAANDDEAKKVKSKSRDDEGPAIGNLTADGFDLVTLAPGASRLKAFDELFEKRETICGLPNAEQMKALAGDEQADIASAALIPLYHERRLGLLMLSSRDESRFASGKGVMFLNQLGEVLSRRLHSLV